MKIKVITFLSRWKNYNPGESAGFPEQFAEKLVQSGIARFKDTPKEEPKAPADPPDKESDLVGVKKPGRIVVKK
jgi:hypothetical protein